MAETIRVTGLRELLATIEESDVELDLWLRDGLLELGEVVAADVRSRYSPKSTKGAAGVKAKVMKRGNVRVVQTLRRSSNLAARRGSFGSYEMRHSFVPAQAASGPATEASLMTLSRRLEEKWQ